MICDDTYGSPTCLGQLSDTFLHQLELHIDVAQQSNAMLVAIMIKATCLRPGTPARIAYIVFVQW